MQRWLSFEFIPKKISVNYIPISCSVYDVLERAALHKKQLHLVLAEKELDVVVQDVFAKENAEYVLCAETEKGTVLTLRLDTIQSIVDPLDGKKYMSNRC